MQKKQIFFIGLTELGKSFYKRFSQSGYSCTFLNEEFSEDTCDLATRMYFSTLDLKRVEAEELIIFSDSDPKLVFETIRNVFSGKKILLFSYFPYSANQVKWLRSEVQGLEDRGIYLIRSFGNYSKSKIENGSLYFHSETIFCTNSIEVASQAQKILFSIGIKAFYAGPIENEGMIQSISDLESAISSFDQLHRNAFFKILSS